MRAKLMVSGFILLVLSLGASAERCFCCGSDGSGNSCSCSKQAKPTELYISQEALKQAIKAAQSGESSDSSSYNSNGDYYGSDSSYALPPSPGYVALCQHKAEQTNQLRSSDSRGSASSYGSTSSYGAGKPRIIFTPRYTGSGSGMAGLAPVNQGKASCSCESCSPGSTSTSPKDSLSSTPLILTLAPVPCSSASLGSGSDSDVAPIQAPSLPVPTPTTYMPSYLTSYVSSYDPYAQPAWRALTPISAARAVANAAAQSTDKTSVVKPRVPCKRHGESIRVPHYENIAVGDFAPSSWPGYGFDHYSDLTAPCECTY